MFGDPRVIVFMIVGFPLLFPVLLFLAPFLILGAVVFGPFIVYYALIWLWVSSRFHQLESFGKIMMFLVVSSIGLPIWAIPYGLVIQCLIEHLITPFSS